MGKKISNIHYAYIAGFLDGDGTIMAIIERHKEKKFKFRVRISLEFTQHEDNIIILQCIKKIIGSGSLSSSNKRVWKLSVKNTKVLKEILKKLEPFVVAKTRQIILALKILNSEVNTRNDLLRMGRLADRLSGFNIKSRSRRLNTSRLLEAFSRND